MNVDDVVKLPHWNH